MRYTLRMPTQLSGEERLAFLARAYHDAEYRWELDGDWHDLRVGLPAPGVEMAYPDAGCFGLLSAWNPWSELRSETDNRAADHVLHERLAASGCTYRAAFASSPNRTWREPSWMAVGMPAEAFDALARDFGQLGTLWWPRGGNVRMRMDAARPQSSDVPDIDWLR